MSGAYLLLSLSDQSTDNEHHALQAAFLSPALKLLTSRGSGEASAQQALDRNYDVDYANVLGEGM